MTSLLLPHLILGLVGLAVMAFVVLRQRGRTQRQPDPVSRVVTRVADKVDPGEAPPLGVLSTPEKSRRMSARFENIERRLRRAARSVTRLPRSSG